MYRPIFARALLCGFMGEMTSSSDVPKHLRVPAIAGVTAIQVIATMAVVMPASIAPEITAEFDLPSSYVGYQISVAYVGAIMMSLAAGLMVRRFGAIRVNQVSASIVCVSLLIFAIPHFSALVIGSLGIGMAYGITNPGANHVMMKIASPENRNLIFSIKQTGQPLGGILAGLMAPPIAVAFGWQWALVVGAALAFAMVLVIQPLREQLDADRDANTAFRGAVFKDVKFMLGDRRLRLLALASLCFSAVQLVLMAYAVTMLVEDISFSLVVAGIGLAALQVAGVVGRLGWGLIADKLRNGCLTLIVIGIVSVGAALVTALLTPSTPDWVIFATLSVFGLSAVGWNGIFMAEIARLAPTGMVGSATGGVMVGVFVGVMLGPLIFNQIYGLVGSYTVSFAVMAVMSVIGMGAVIRLMMLERRKRT